MSNSQNRTIRIGVLAVQGAFAEHRDILAKLGVETFEIRQLRDIAEPFDGLVLPGGESTVQGKLLKDLGLFEPLKKLIQDGLPVFGTCAGLILLAESLSNDPNVYFGTLPVTVQRNAYGRQLGSFFAELPFKDVGVIPMTFIRAPVVDCVRESQGSAEKGDATAADVLATTADGQIVAVRYKNQLGITFHPELNEDLRLHEYFVKIVKDWLQNDVLDETAA